MKNEPDILEKLEILEDRINALRDELAKVSRRQDSANKGIDSLNEDREILESVQSRLTAVEEQQKLSKQNDNKIQRDIKEEINLANDRVIAKVEAVIESGIQALSKGGKKNKSWVDKILRR